MKAAAAKDRTSDRLAVDVDAVRIGKDVIEILTSGMYVSPVTIYREYIQNAADAIDAARSQGLLAAGKAGKVSISFDHAARSVAIRDGGAGIGARDALPILLAIGASPKRGTQARGFRGVGRLSGLAYCRELEFRTKAAGEDKIVSVAWDCRALRERLSDAAFGGDLRRIVSDVVSVWYETVDDPSDHFFEVRLTDIARLRNDLLLNERVISHYLAQVGPVPFASEFSFAAEIGKRLATYSHRVPINLTVAGEAVLRPYRDELVFPATLSQAAHRGHRVSGISRRGRRDRRSCLDCSPRIRTQHSADSRDTRIESALWRFAGWRIQSVRRILQGVSVQRLEHWRDSCLRPPHCPECPA